MKAQKNPDLLTSAHAEMRNYAQSQWKVKDMLRISKGRQEYCIYMMQRLRRRAVYGQTLTYRLKGKKDGNGI